MVIYLINQANQEVLERFFKVAIALDEREARELAGSIIDWRDSDNELSILAGSAEDNYYQNLLPPYESKDSEYEILEEILLVKGMGRDIFGKIKNYVIIYGNGKININIASRVVLLALGLTQDLADKILSFRASADAITGTFDDNVFETPSNIVLNLSQFCHLSDSEKLELSLICGQYLVTNSNNFMARCIATLNSKKIQVN